LVGGRLGYRVKHASQLRGNRSLSLVWKHGADLAYTDNDGKLVRVWLCKLCHLLHAPGAAKVVDGYSHIITHLLKEHRIDLSTGGLLPDSPRTPVDPWAASRVVGAQSVVSKTAWQEGGLQSSVVDWVILQD
jgi:hypothetical protein